MRKLISIIFCFLSIQTYAQKAIQQGDVTVELLNDHQIIPIQAVHKSYSILYAVDYQNPEVALAYLDKENVNKERGFERPRSFSKQNSPKQVLVKHDTYTNSDKKFQSFDRGHMIPNDMMDYNKDYQKDTFAVYNICPQYPECNARGSAWYQIEQQIEKRAWSYGRVYVITGPVFDKKVSEYPKLKGLVVIPEKFYKILLSYDSEEKSFVKIEVFIFTNSKTSEKDVSSCLRSSWNKDSDKQLQDTLDDIKKMLNLKIKLS